MQKITSFLMFTGKAEEAMNFYMSLFPDSEIVSIVRYGPNQAGTEDSVTHASFTLYGQLFMCIDSPAQHQFTFTPAMSLDTDDKTIIRKVKSLFKNPAKRESKSAGINEFYEGFKDGIHEVKLSLDRKTELKDAKTWVNEL